MSGTSDGRRDRDEISTDDEEHTTRMSEALTGPTRTLTLPLEPAIDYKGGKLVELTLKEPTGAQMRDAEKALDKGLTPAAESDYAANLIGAVSGLSEDALNALPISVIRQARQFLDGFDRWPENPPPPLPTCEVPLSEEITADGTRYTSLKLREPTFLDHRRAQTALSQGQTASATRSYQLILLAQTSGIPFATIERFPVSVLNAGQAYLMGFMEPGRPTGSASSAS